MSRKFQGQAHYSRPSRKKSFVKNFVEISASRELIVIDAAPIKRAEQEKCKEILIRLDLARERLRTFTEVDEPSYQRWLNSTFGNEITGLRDLNQALQELRQLISEIEHYHEVHRCSLRKAYQKVMDLKKDPGSIDPETKKKEKWYNKEQEERREREYREEREAEKEARESFKSFFGFDFSDFEEDDENQEEGGSEESIVDNSLRDRVLVVDSRVKGLYRTLARKLHPDQNADLDQKRKDLWYQVQDAYENQDIDRLETLFAMNQIFDNKSEDIESVWSLKSLFHDLQSGLKQLQKQINKSKKNIAWNFDLKQTNLKKMKELRSKIFAEMKDSAAEFKCFIRNYEQQLEKWKNPPQKKAPAPQPQSTPRSFAFKGRKKWTKAEMDAYTGFGERV